MLDVIRLIIVLICLPVAIYLSEKEREDREEDY